LRSRFSGSQRQANADSVQGELERALAVVLKQETAVVLAGRTDAGVHAIGQCAKFETEHTIPVERVPAALNSVLDRGVRVLCAREVDEEFHPRYSARSRVYRYTVYGGEQGNPLIGEIATHEREVLEVEAMREAARAFIGEHDFAAWESAGSPSKRGTVRRVERLEISERPELLGSPLLEFEIEADAFLYRMVRNIIGALLEVGRGRLTPDDMERLMSGRDRTKCPPPAPPQGLCLVRVNY